MSARGVALDKYDYMGDTSADLKYSDHANARHVYARLVGTKSPRMPKGGPFWLQAKLDLYKSWIDEGFQP